ncbi:prolyl oligopeptidase PreP (S9A serine peptidase family) [Bradyrhizobium sp. LB7.1]
MRRYTKLLAGANWPAEYGGPDKAQEWEWLKTYSAYHAARPGQSYPPILMATRRRDDRVHPGHARKMAAKLQAMAMRLISMSMPPAATAMAKTIASTPACWCWACVS